MAVINKNNTTNRTLTSAACWEPAPDTGIARVPLTTDSIRWYSASNAGGNHTGSLTVLGVQVDGATADITYTSGTLTLTQTDAFVNGPTNNRLFTVFTGGVFALGSADRTFRLYKTLASANGQCLAFNVAGALTGSGTLTVVDDSAGTARAPQIVIPYAFTGFTGTVRLEDNVQLLMWNASQSVLTNANIVMAGSGSAIYAAASNVTLGASGRQLAIDNNVTLGLSGFTFTIASNVVLGSVARTLTVNGNTIMSGTATGTAGVTATIQNSTDRAGGAGNKYLQLTGSSSGVTGACSVSGGRFIVAPTTTAARYAPSSLTVASDAVFEYYPMSNTDFTFPCAPSGTGYVAIFGNHTAGGGVTFSPGQLASFGGIVRVEPDTAATFQAPRIRLFELPAGLDWFAVPNAATAMTGDITYLGSTATYATNLTLDSYKNTSVVGLTGGVYSLTVPNTSGTLTITGTVQRLNTADTSSARMSLTLAGTNTGDNTLSGNISQVGTNSAILGITKVDAGRWVLSGNNSHTGQIDVSAGTLAAHSATALGGTTGTVIIRDGATLELSGGHTFDKSDADWEARSASGGINSIGANTIRCRNFALIETTTTFTVTTGNKLTIDPQLSGATEGVISGESKGITKAGAGELELAANANTFSGALTVSAGTLTVGSVANATPSPVAASWGQASSTVLVSGTLKYNGAPGTGSSNRAVQMTGSAPTLDASGSGALTLSNVTQDTTAKTMTLRGTSTDANTISNAIANNTGAVSLAKEDAGRWVLSGALSYTGTTAVNGGTLRVETTNSNTTSGAVTIGASGTVELVTATLASSGASAGEVLGTGNVTVNGVVKTRGGTTQKGQVRYGGNLTFGVGSSLHIGAAA